MLVIALILLFVTYFGKVEIFGEIEREAFETMLTNFTIKQQYSREERIALDKLHQLLTTSDMDLIPKDEYYQRDSFLYRFLLSRNNNVKAAHKSILETFAWRAENNIDSIVSENIYNLSKPIYHIGGHDKEGRPLFQIFPYHVDVRKLIIGGKQGAILWYTHQILERVFDYLKNTKDRMNNGDEIIDFTVVHDASGFSVKLHACLPCLKTYLSGIHHYLDYFPETYARAIMVNVPQRMLPFIKPFYSLLPEYIQKRVKIFGTDKKEWSEYLLSIIPEDQVLERFGGTKRTQFAIILISSNNLKQ